VLSHSVFRHDLSSFHAIGVSGVELSAVLCMAATVCCVVKVALLEEQNANVEKELRERVNDLHNLQSSLNTSRIEHINAVNQLQDMQHDLVQQQVRNKCRVAENKGAHFI